MIPALKKQFPAVAILSIIAATFAVYWPSLQNQFVWDDTALILRDPFIRSWRLIPEGFRHFLFSDATASDFYRPMQRLTYTLDYALYAFQPWGYHLTGILLHAAAAAALFLCARRLMARFNAASSMKGELLAWAAAFAWAVHPVHSAAVSYAAGRADVLAALFGFTGLFFAAGTEEGKSPRRAEWIAASCFLLAMLSKESGVTALIIWLVALLCLRDKAAMRRWLVLAVAIAAGYSVLRFSAEKTAPPEKAPMSIAVRPILMARAWAEYAGLLVAPVNLHMERDILVKDHAELRQTLRDATLREYEMLLGVLLIAAFVLWLRCSRRQPGATSFFLIAFLIAYLPTSNLLSLNATVAEHWLYFSSAFLFAAAALSLDAVRFPRRAMLAGMAVWLGCLGARTFMRNFDWKDQRTFLLSTAVSGGDTARTLINLGVLESSEGRQRIAIAYFKEALAQSPDQPFALLGLGTAYLRNHDYAKAREQFNKALIIPFSHDEAMENIAVLDYQEKGVDRIDLLQKAAKFEPENWAFQKRYITHLAERGELLRAIHELRGLVEQQPYRSESWELLGDLLVKAGQTQMAQTAYEYASDYDVHFKKHASAF
jgi:Flp pilus assembly protein TadD